NRGFLAGCTLKTGHFYFAENRTFLFCVDRYDKARLTNVLCYGIFKMWIMIRVKKFFNFVIIIIAIPPEYPR
ncbi:MAG: hypothetical protein JXR81_10125, partial [Candidatus Goldbacteria bacterium]|nr:hypothetical protein [Candidatus Goldiibacteriota bacterium]